MPYWWLIRGSQVEPNRKSLRLTSLKNSRAGARSEMTIPTVVRTDTTAAANSRPRMRASPRRGRRSPKTDVAPADAAAEASIPCTADRRLAGRGLSLLELALGGGELRRRHRHDLRRLGDLGLVLQDEVHEPADLLLGQGLLARVHEQRPGQRLVAAVLDRRLARSDALPGGLGHLDQVDL